MQAKLTSVPNLSLYQLPAYKTVSPDKLQWYSMDDIDDLLDEAEKVCEFSKATKIKTSDVNDHVSRLGNNKKIQER